MSKERTVPAESFCQMLTANVDNEKLSAKDFREFVRNTLPIIIGAEVEERPGGGQIS